MDSLPIMCFLLSTLSVKIQASSSKVQYLSTAPNRALVKEIVTVTEVACQQLDDGENVDTLKNEIVYVLYDSFISNCENKSKLVYLQYFAKFQFQIGFYENEACYQERLWW